MGFWSGFEGLTGHRPGAFKRFSFKDILDDDLWKRHERLGGRQSRQFEETGVVPTTAWYRGRGRPEMMGPRVGAVSPQVQLNPAEQRASNLMRDQGMQAVQESQRVDSTLPSYAEQHAAIMRNRYPRISQDTLRALRPVPNIQTQMLRDSLQGVGSMRIPTAELMGTQVPQVQPNRRPFQMSGMAIPPAELMGEKTTVKKIFADPTKSDTVTETIKEKVPMGDMRIPTSELMGARSLAPRRQPTSIMDMMIPIGELMEMRRRRDQMRFRQNPYHMLQGV